MGANIVTCVVFVLMTTISSHPDEDLTITQLITKHHYSVEEHTIETFDGYLLTTFRIPHGKGTKARPQRAVLIAHGLGSSADDWVLLGADALPYYLADNGFDVWLFNARGTHHSRRHKTLDPDRDAKLFWNFCWHEMGLYDLPANINYILKQTGANKLFYVGHSQGGTILLVMLSMLPEMNKKISAAALLAPAAYFDDEQVSMLLKISSVAYPFGSENQNFFEFPPKVKLFTNDVMKDTCSQPQIKFFCYNSLYIETPGSERPIDQELITVIVQHTPSTISTKQIQHFIQIKQTGEFKLFDYGERLNLKKYRFSKPPFYNISEISTPMALFYGKGDKLASPMSVKRIASELKNDHSVYEVPFNQFNHIDFLWARNAKNLVYKKVYEILDKFDIPNRKDTSIIENYLQTDKGREFYNKQNRLINSLTNYRFDRPPDTTRSIPEALHRQP